MVSPPAAQGPALPAAETAADDERFHSTLMVTFLFACLYIGLTVLGTTHRLLLVGEDITLQPLSVGVKLTGFYYAAPLVIIALHVHLLLIQHVTFRRSQGQAEQGIVGVRRHGLFPLPLVFRNLPHADERWVEPLVQFGFFLIHVALPLAVLCLVQYEFLPYHSVEHTRWHQLAILIDLVIVWAVLFFLRAEKLRRIKFSVLTVLGLVATFMLLFFSFCMAIIPGTCIEASLDGPFLPASWLKRNLDLAGEELIGKSPPPELLAAYQVKGESLEHAYLEHSVGLSLADRDLRYGNFEGANLIKADLRGADLRWARLVGADLRQAKLAPAGLSNTLLQHRRGARKSEDIAAIADRSIRRSHLDGAMLQEAKLEGAILILVSMVGADLHSARMAGVELTRADLRYANLEEADLAGAEISYASLDGAHLDGARLGAATLARASITGASLRGVRAVAASFASADLTGAQLTSSVLKAAEFRDAKLVGSDLRNAALQGATSLKLEAVDLRGAHLGGVCDVLLTSLADLRAVDFNTLPSGHWDTLRDQLRERLSTQPRDERQAVLQRIKRLAGRRMDSEEQAACLGAPLAEQPLLASRRLLYFDERWARTEVLNNLPPLEDQGDSWDEAAFHRELAGVLIERACSSPGLARTVERRAAGEYMPGDLDLDLELARQLMAKLEGDPSCVELRKIGEHRKRLISWRIRRAASDEGRR